MNELNLLELKDLLLTKEFIIIKSKADLEENCHWTSNWNEPINEIDKEISELKKAIREKKAS